MVIFAPNTIMMKKYTLSALTTFALSTMVFGQTSEGAMDDFNEYIEYTLQQNWEGVINYMPTYFTEQVGHDMLLNVLEQTVVQIEQAGITLDDFTNFDAGDDFIEFDGSKHYILSYTTHMTFKGAADQMDQMKSMAGPALGADRAEIQTLEDGSNVLRLEVPSYVLASAKMGTEDWRFMRYTDDQKALLAQLTSQEFVDALGEIE